MAIDGSAHAARALEEALDLAQTDNALLTIMTAVPDPSAWVLGGPAYADWARLSEQTEREYRELLDEAVSRVPQDVSVTKRLVHGRPGDRILEQIKEGHHDLVVMGSRGRGNVRSLVLGSVSHQVLNAAPAAALIVHAEAATDGSGTDRQAAAAHG